MKSLSKFYNLRIVVNQEEYIVRTIDEPVIWELLFSVYGGKAMVALTFDL